MRKASSPILDRERYAPDSVIHNYRRIREIGWTKENRGIIAKAETFFWNAEEIFVKINVIILVMKGSKSISALWNSSRSYRAFEKGKRANFRNCSLLHPLKHGVPPQR